MVKNFLFLYLNTGGGHVSSAKSVKMTLEEKYGSNAKVILYNGFNTKQWFAKLFFEQGYRFTSTVASGLYSLIYEVTKNSWWLKFYRYFSSISTAHYLKKQLVEYDISTVVSFHFALSPAAARAIQSLEKDISFVTVVTDPFTAHPIWFIEKKHRFVVFSESLKDEAVAKYGIDEKNITVMPFLMNPKFLVKPTASYIEELKKKHGFASDKKIVLIAGGGEGLPGALEIVHKCVAKKVSFTLAVVCGRDLATKTMLEVIQKTHPKFDLKIFGFVPFMDELVKLCDCAVIKAGPATLLEVLKSGKPVIISKYIHGQELGNVHFAVKNHAGWFIQKPETIVQKIQELFTDKNYYNTITKQVKQLSIKTDSGELAEYVYNLCATKSRAE